MVVGVPGTGIGGLFYLIAACSMPFVECWRWLRGERSHSGTRWGFIAGQLALMGGIIAAMTLQAVAARRLFAWWAAQTSDQDLARSLDLIVRQHAGATAGFVTFFSLAMLAFVVLAVHALRITVGRRARRG